MCFLTSDAVGGLLMEISSENPQDSTISSSDADQNHDSVVPVLLNHGYILLLLDC